MRDWMVGFLERWGFWGVVLMSAWPNAAFDMCGMACGHFGMGFWTFFGGTLVGKGVIKVIGQTVFFCFLFAAGDDNIERLVAVVEGLIPDRWEPCRLLLGPPDCHERLHQGLLRLRRSFTDGSAAASAGGGGGMSILGLVWNGIIGLFILYFVVGVIEGLAHHRWEREKHKAE